MKKQFFTLLTLLISIMAQSQTLAPNTNIGSYKVPKLEYYDSLCGVNSQLVIKGHIARIIVRTFTDTAVFKRLSGAIDRVIKKNDYYLCYVPVNAIYKNSIGFEGDTVIVKLLRGLHPEPKPGIHEDPDFENMPPLGLGKVFFLTKKGNYFYITNGLKDGVAVARDSEEYPFRFGYHCFKKESQMYRYMAQAKGVVFPDSLMDEVLYVTKVKRDSLARVKGILKAKRDHKIDILKQLGIPEQEINERMKADSVFHSINKNHQDSICKKNIKKIDSIQTIKKKILNINKSARLAATLGINLRLTNPRYTKTTNITGTVISLDFDVEVSSSSTTYLDNLPIRLKYNANVFDANAGASIALAFSNTNNTYMNPDNTVSNPAFDEISFSLTTNYPNTAPSRIAIGSTYKKIFTVTMYPLACKELPNIDFIEPQKILDASFYTVKANDPILGVNILFKFNSITTNTFTFNTYCGPTITNFSPQTITAGTGSILTITGTGFGATKGELKFVNADTTSNKPETGINYNDLVWSDTKIEYKVHSVSSPQNTVVGSGNFRVVTAAKDSTDANADVGSTLTVPYSIINGIQSSTGFTSPRFPVQQTPNNGNAFVFHIKANEQQTAVLIKAIKDLRCYTGINFLYTAIQREINYGFADDGYSTLSFGIVDAAKPKVLAGTLDYGRQSCTSGGYTWFAKTETDIVFKESQVWNYDTTGATVLNGQANLYEVALHELGHAAGLDHIVSSILLMQPTTSTFGISASKRYSLSKYSNETVKEGIDWLFSIGSMLPIGNSSCSNFNGMQRFSGACNAVYLADEQFYGSVQILNNPTIDGKTAVRFQLTKPEAVNLRLVDMMGRELRSYTKSYAASEIVEEIDLGSFASGLYGLVIQKGNDLQMYRIVKH